MIVALIDYKNLLNAQNTENVYIEKIEVTGNTIFEREINNIITPYQQQNISLEELDQIVEEIISLYLNQGYITTRASLDNIDENNIVSIKVKEGQIEAIKIEGADRLEGYIRDRIALGATNPLNSNSLEDQLRLLKANPLIENIEASLTKGSGDRQTILEIKVTEANPFFGEVGVDNFSPPSIGSTQAVFNLGSRNVFGFGDSLGVSLRPRFENGLNTYNIDVAYNAPINAMDGKIQARVSIQENDVTEGFFKDLEISGESQYYELSYRQPIIRNPREELALSLGMSYRNGQTFTFQGPTPFGIGPDEDGISRTNVITFGQDYALRQPNGAWGFRSQFRMGVGLLNVTQAKNSGDPDGYFFSWLGQIQRVQILSPDNFLIIQGDIQLSDSSLLPSEQFVIGGGQSVRGYRQNVRSGDNGFRFSIEDRITLVRNDEQLPVFQIAPFWDMGAVWNSGDNPNFLPDQTFITALGLGLIWQPIEGLNLRLDYAPPLIELDDKGDNIQDHGFYFNLKYDFPNNSQYANETNRKSQKLVENNEENNQTIDNLDSESSYKAEDLLVEGEEEIIEEKTGWAIVPTISTMGLGGSLTTSLTPNLNFSVGLHGFTYSHSYKDTDVRYEGDINLFNLSSVIDYYPFANSGFHLRAGAVFSQNNIDANGKPTNNTFTINNQSYSTDDLKQINGKVKFSNDVSPYLGIGWGNPVGRGQDWNFFINLGVFFAGSPDVSLTPVFGDISPSLQQQIISDLKGEEKEIEDDINWLNIYPVLSIGFSYQF